MSVRGGSRGTFAAHCVAGAAVLFTVSAGQAVAKTWSDRTWSDGAWSAGPSSPLLERAQFTADGRQDAPLAITPIRGIAGQEIPVSLELPANAGMMAQASQTFILVRNIPPAVRLSAGMANGRFWILPIKELDGLRLVAQPGTTGSFDLEFTLIGPNNKKIAQWIVRLELTSPDIAGRLPTIGALATVDSLPVDPPRPRPPAPSRSVSGDEEAVLLKRGRELLDQGGIAAARIIFEELGNKGSAEGALALARSYDPAYAVDPRLSAILPDMKKALIWYQRAQELGSGEARARLAEISPRR